MPNYFSFVPTEELKGMIAPGAKLDNTIRFTIGKKTYVLEQTGVSFDVASRTVRPTFNAVRESFPTAEDVKIAKKGAR